MLHARTFVALSVAVERSVTRSDTEDLALSVAKPKMKPTPKCSSTDDNACYSGATPKSSGSPSHLVPRPPPLPSHASNERERERGRNRQWERRPTTASVRATACDGLPDLRDGGASATASTPTTTSVQATCDGLLDLRKGGAAATARTASMVWTTTPAP